MPNYEIHTVEIVIYHVHLFWNSIQVISIKGSSILEKDKLYRLFKLQPELKKDILRGVYSKVSIFIDPLKEQTSDDDEKYLMHGRI